MKPFLCLVLVLASLSAFAAETHRPRGGAPGWLKKMVKPIVKRASVTTLVARV